MKHTMNILDATGHTAYEWDPEDDGAVAVAERAFDEAVRTRGRPAFEVRDGKATRQMDRFEAEVENITVVAPITGG